MIYFDNAATSFPKPQEVYREVMRCMTKYGGNPGRSSHSLALAAAQKIFECRSLMSELFGIDDPERVFFTLNTTYALNAVIKGGLQRGDHVLISDIEHNAVYRPIYKLAQSGYITYDIFPSMVCDERRSPVRICASIARLVRPETKMVICTLSSNLCSMTMPIAEIGAFCHRRGIIFVVDGAQGAGHIQIDFDRLPIDALCLPGHKGLLGPQGCGLVILGKNYLPDTLTEGGNGVDSLDGNMGDVLPERYEAGTVATPAIAGLCEGIRWILSHGIDDIAEHEKKLYRRAREILCGKKEITVYAPEYEGSVLLFSKAGEASEALASKLGENGICVRGGFHCSALGHKTLKTQPDGAVRISFGPFNTLNEVEILSKVL